MLDRKEQVRLGREENIRRVKEWKTQGLSNAEMAKKLNTTESVIRFLIKENGAT